MAVLRGNSSYDLGDIFITYRFWCRRKGISVEILSVKPRIIKELPILQLFMDRC